jgi:hypothetical protein
LITTCLTGDGRKKASSSSGFNTNVKSAKITVAIRKGTASLLITYFGVLLNTASEPSISVSVVPAATFRTTGRETPPLDYAYTLALFMRLRQLPLIPGSVGATIPGPSLGALGLPFAGNRP